MSLGAGALRQLINLGWAVSSWEWSRGGVNGAQCDEFIRVSTFLVPDNTGTNYLTWGETKYARRKIIIIPCDFFKAFHFQRRIFSFYFTEEETLLSFAHPIMIQMMLKVNKPRRSLQPGGVRSNVVSDPGLTSDCGKHVNNSNNYPAMLFVIQ